MGEFWEILVGFEGEWSNEDNKVALGFRLHLSPVFLAIFILSGIYSMNLALLSVYFLEHLKEGKLIKELGEISWAIFSRLHLLAIFSMVDNLEPLHPRCFPFPFHAHLRPPLPNLRHPHIPRLPALLHFRPPQPWPLPQAGLRLNRLVRARPRHRSPH